jgi:hypothetical protein
MISNRLKIIITLAGMLIFSQMARSQFPGGPYLGQQFPGAVPEQFAPGLLPEFTSSLTFTPDGLECFSTRWYPASGMILMTTKEQGGSWPEFDTAFFSVDLDQLPYLTADGNRLYFISYIPIPPSPYYIRHLWFTDRAGSTWSEPAVMDSPIKEHYVISTSAASNGNLYLSIDDNNDAGIYISRFVNGNYEEPEKLSDSINYLNRPLRPFITPDERYLLFDAGETQDPLSQRDIYISHRNADETWSKAIALDETVNTEGTEVVSFISRDNQLLFFSREGNLYWMDASNILTGIETHREIKSGAILNQNFPNPFRGVTTIGYSLPSSSFVTLEIYDMMNKKAAALVNEEQPAGDHVISFDAANLPGGIYVCLLRIDDTSLIRKMVLVK